MEIDIPLFLKTTGYEIGNIHMNVELSGIIKSRRNIAHICNAVGNKAYINPILNQMWGMICSDGRCARSLADNAPADADDFMPAGCVPALCVPKASKAFAWDRTTLENGIMDSHRLWSR
jgi:hypothetical protein